MICAGGGNGIGGNGGGQTSTEVIKYKVELTPRHISTKAIIKISCAFISRSVLKFVAI